MISQSNLINFVTPFVRHRILGDVLIYRVIDCCRPELKASLSCSVARSDICRGVRPFSYCVQVP